MSGLEESGEIVGGITSVNVPAAESTTPYDPKYLLDPQTISVPVQELRDHRDEIVQQLHRLQSLNPNTEGYQLWGRIEDVLKTPREQWEHDHPGQTSINLRPSSPASAKIS
jgi:hypothetical protein